MLYDPYKGWMYGFPKPYKPLPGESLEDTLIRDGYPKQLVKEIGEDKLWCRFISEQAEFTQEDLSIDVIKEYEEFLKNV